MDNQFDEFTKNLAQSVTRRGSNTRKQREQRFFFRSRLPLFAHGAPSEV